MGCGDFEIGDMGADADPCLQFQESPTTSIPTIAVVVEFGTELYRFKPPFLAELPCPLPVMYYNFAIVYAKSVFETSRSLKSGPDTEEKGEVLLPLRSTRREETSETQEKEKEKE